MSIWLSINSESRVTSILLFLYFLFICCSYICVTVYACSHVCGYTCVCIWSFKVDTGCLPQLLFILYAEVGFLTKSGSCPTCSEELLSLSSESLNYRWPPHLLAICVVAGCLNSSSHVCKESALSTEPSL